MKTIATYLLMCTAALADIAACRDAVIKSDYATAFKECAPLAKAGIALAQYNLGLMYDTGNGVPKDAVQAVSWYRKAAEQGYASAQNNLGLMYYTGNGVPKDFVTWRHFPADIADFRVKGQTVRGGLFHQRSLVPPKGR